MRRAQSFFELPNRGLARSSADVKKDDGWRGIQQVILRCALKMT
jgi:hypothetical protein